MCETFFVTKRLGPALVGRMNTQVRSSSPSCSGARLVDVAGRTLPLRGTEIEVHAGSGLARTLVEQRFHNPYEEPLRVTYLLPLPADAAVAGYAFSLGEARFEARIATREEARERFEQAVLEGHTAALLEEERSSLFTQELGNVPPGAEIVVEVELDQPLEWLQDGTWEWRFPTVVGPRYLGAEGRVPDADKITVDIADGALDARARVTIEIADEIQGRPPHSPSHAFAANQRSWVLREDAGARLDRDVVLRWQVARPQPGATLALARGTETHARVGSAFGLLTLVPPEPRHPLPPVARDLVFLVDVSGSMGGDPLAQAQRVMSALIDGLDARDRLEILAFSSSVQRWRADPTVMEGPQRKAAQAYVAALRAGGGTEMRTGIVAALQRLRGDAQRQVLVVTDGYIGFEEEIVAAILGQLPKGSKVHMLGVGQAVNRTLTRSAARAGGGSELIIAPGEDVEPLVRRVLAELAQPILVDLELSGTALRSCGIARLPDLHGACPARIPVELDPAGGDLVLRGNTAQGPWHERLTVPALATGEGSRAVLLRFAREHVEDLEAARASGVSVDEAIARVGLDFSIATRRTSFVAVSTDATVDPTVPTRTVAMPHELAAGLSAEGVGLRAAAMSMAYCAAVPAGIAAPAGVAGATLPRSAPSPMTTRRRISKVAMPRGAAPAPAPVPVPAKRSGVFGASAPSEPSEKAMPRERVALRGQLTRAGRRAIVSVTLDRPIVWTPEHAFATRADGTLVELAIDPAVTTAPGQFSQGQTVRLVFSWEGDDPTEIVLGEGLVITL